MTFNEILQLKNQEVIGENNDSHSSDQTSSEIEETYYMSESEKQF